MSKYKFIVAERYAIWKVLGPQCRWCNQPVEYSECHIDHIIPERLLERGRENEKLEVLSKYGLDTSFEINSFANWIPVHSSCNLSKQGKVIEAAPIFLDLLNEVKQKSSDTAALSEKWKKENKSAKLLATIERGAELGSISIQTVTRIFAGINDNQSPIAGLTGSTINNSVFFVPNNQVWQVLSTEDGFYTLQKDGMVGLSPVDPSADPKWLCTHCMNYGPWDGNQCLICGKFSFD
ncbi:MAG: HNH endonuclease [Bacteroidetes bacterium]|nr:HNH endonuclease [Bacteroidota bacterium]